MPRAAAGGTTPPPTDNCIPARQQPPRYAPTTAVHPKEGSSMQMNLGFVDNYIKEHTAALMLAVNSLSNAGS